MFEKRLDGISLLFIAGPQHFTASTSSNDEQARARTPDLQLICSLFCIRTTSPTLSAASLMSMTPDLFSDTCSVVADLVVTDTEAVTPSCCHEVVPSSLIDPIVTSTCSRILGAGRFMVQWPDQSGRWRAARCGLFRCNSNDLEHTMRPLLPLLLLLASPLGSLSSSDDARSGKLVELIQKVRSLEGCAKARSESIARDRFESRLVSARCMQRQYDLFTKELSKEGTDPNQPTPKGQLPIIEAVKTKNIKFVDSLIQVPQAIGALNPCPAPCPDLTAPVRHAVRSSSDRQGAR